MENLNEEREVRTDKEMIKRKCKIEKWRKIWTKKEKEEQIKSWKRRKKNERERKEIKKERLLGNFCHCIHACLSSKKNK